MINNYKLDINIRKWKKQPNTKHSTSWTLSTGQKKPSNREMLKILWTEFHVLPIKKEGQWTEIKKQEKQRTFQISILSLHQPPSFKNGRIIPNKQLPNYENKKTLKKHLLNSTKIGRDKRNHRKNCSNIFPRLQ